MPLFPGQILQQRYRIQSLLGQGGMGAVYRAEDMRLHISVAVKELLPQPGLDPHLLSRLRAQFLQEATILARLNHPHLVNVTDYFEEDGKAYLIMRFIEGESLADHIARHGALPEAQVVTWALEILEALDYCHARNILHRDLKPHNIIIQPNGSVVLVDFGLVKLWNPADPQTRTTIRGAGTPEYAPPEQYGATSGHTDPRSDIYSLGATLYHALTGQVPPSATERIAFPQHFRTPRELNGRVSPGIDGVIQKAMALPQEQRWSSAREMAIALQSGSGNIPPTPVLPPASKRRRPAWLWGSGVLVLLLVLAASVIMANRGCRSTITTSPTPVTLIAAMPITATVTQTSPPDLRLGEPEPPVEDATALVVPTSTPEQRPTPIAMPVPTVTPVPVLRFKTVPLGAAANAAWGHFEAPPQGDVVLGGIPFTLAAQIFKSQAEPAPDNTYPSEVTIKVHLSQAQRLYLLLTAGNAFVRYTGTAVGGVEAVCNDVTYPIATLTVGQNLREWHTVGDVVAAAPEVELVWRGALKDSPNLTGHIDMLTLSLPAACQNGTLTAVRVLDFSTETAHSRDPALNLIGLTLGYYP